MINLLFPKVCNACKSLLLKEEILICTKCRHSLSVISNLNFGEQLIKQLFFGKIVIENASVLLKFEKKGITQELLHNMKYRGKKNLSSFFGKWLGDELKEKPSYKDIDLVIPVPLDKKRLKKRGYNQVEGFGIEIAKALKVPYLDKILIKDIKTNSQVFKKRFNRFHTSGVFRVVQPKLLDHQHVLLVDDIITTGATIEKCAHQLFKSKQVKLSLATIAIA